MSYMKKKTARKKEWDMILKKEERFLSARDKKEESLLNRKLEEKVPKQLQDKLDAAFEKAFSLIFKKGTGVIEKTMRTDKVVHEYQVDLYSASIKEDAKALRTFSRKANRSGGRNLLFSGVEGIGLGLLGVGLPDIPLFTALILKNLYELALHYGFSYDTQEERYWILLLIRGALCYGEDAKAASREADLFIKKESLPQAFDMSAEIRKTAETLSGELLYMKFLQGIPIAGAVGGAYDVIYLRRIQRYAGIKYKKRFLYRQAWREKGEEV